MFKISNGSYYNWLKGKPSKRHLKNESLRTKIQIIHKASDQTYGSPRIWRDLRAMGEEVSEPRVARLMRKAGIRSVYKKKFVVKTDSKHNYPIVKNVLDRQFSTERKNKVWVSDITYVKTTKGWLYLTVIIDLYSRKVIGWSMSKDMTAENTSIAAWRMAIQNQPITEPLIFHSDRGIQYACSTFSNLLNADPLVTRSMSRKGNCWDNAVAESFFKTFKVEKIYREKYFSQEQAQLAIFHLIETWYNRKRRHSAIDYMTIEEFENSIINHKLAA